MATNGTDWAAVKRAARRVNGRLVSPLTRNADTEALRRMGFRVWVSGNNGRAWAPAKRCPR